MSKTLSLLPATRALTANLRGPLVGQALALVDPERVSSVTGLLGAYHQQALGIRDDRELSPEGQASRTRAAADARLGSLTNTARQLVELEQKHAAKVQATMRGAVPAADDLRSVLADLALAAQVKATAPTTQALELASVRTRQAVARLPAELSGLADAAHLHVTASLVSPAAARELADERQALSAVREVIQAGITELADVARPAPGDLVRGFGGGGWRLPGVVESVVAALPAAPAPAA